MTWIYIIIVTAGPPLSSAFRFLLTAPVRSWPRFYFSWALTGGTVTVIALIGRLWPAMLAALAGTAVAVIAWWLSRRRRKRAPRMYGAKSRALVAACVRRMRGTARPRPVLRPVPGGAS